MVAILLYQKIKVLLAWAFGRGFFERMVIWAWRPMINETCCRCFLQVVSGVGLAAVVGCEVRSSSVGLVLFV
jgi:hypothetical protein